jgi:TetR/AcrR family transcriptional regulator, cholesterol catabolism regulator
MTIRNRGQMEAADSVRARAEPPRRRRQEVLDAATQLFHERGYAASSIQDLADELGILKGSIYYYIKSKDDLLYEILKDVHEDALVNMKTVEEMDGDALQKIRAFVTLHIRSDLESPARVGVFHRDFRSLSNERQRMIIDERRRYDRTLRKLIRQGQEDGVVCPDVDPPLAALAALGMVNSVYQWYRPSGRQSVLGIAHQFADLIVAGLVCDPSTHTPGHRASRGPIPAGFSA